MAFERQFSDEGIQALQQEELFQKFLYPDIVETFQGNKDANRDVFPAVRKDRIDFYHRGGKLFSYNGKAFSTHQKYASVLACPKDSVTEADLRQVSPITSFTEHYERIKENCALYAGDEAESVSRLYNRFSCTKRARTGDIVVLDIEVSFTNMDDDRPDTDRKRSRQDRIDILLYDTSERKLRFFEAKLFSNGEIRAKGNAEPRVVNQMKRYRAQLKNNEESILAQYENHVKVINRLFGSNLPEPESLDLEPRLYMFGFDNDQKEGRLKENLETLSTYGVKIYAKGDPTSVKARALWTSAN